MKKILSVLLAASMLTGMSVTAFARSYDYLKPNGDKKSDSNAVYLEEMDEYDDDDDIIELEPGETYEFDLVNSNGDSVECVSSSDLRDYDDDDDDVFYVKATVDEGKSYVSSCKIDDDELVIKTKSNVTRDKKFTIELKAKNPDGKYKYSYYEFVIIGEDSSSNSEKEEIDDDEWDLDLDERYSLKFDRDLARCKLIFDDEVYVAMRLGSTTKYTIECDTTENKRVIADAPNSAELTFYKFPNKNRLEYSATVGIEINNDEKYVYEIDSNNKLTDLNATKKNGYLTFTTDKLGAYVASDTKLSTSGSSSSSGSSTSKPTGGSSSSAATENVTYNTLRNALNGVSYNGTAVVNITDSSYVNVSDLKSAFQGNTGKQIKFVCKNGNSVKYQYYMNYRQVAAMTGSTYNLGLDMSASSTKSLFNRYFKNKVVVVGSKASPNGAKAVFAAKVNLSSLNTSNLKVYAYDRSKNHYELVANPYLSIDANGYTHYTVPIGYDIIFTDSYMTSK